MAVNAVGGGWYGLAGADGVPVEWLAGSPFDSYRVPSLVLMLGVGSTQLAGGVLVLVGAKQGSTVAIAAAAVLMAWIGTQLAIIGFVSWLQPAVLAIAALEATMAIRLRRGEGARRSR